MTNEGAESTYTVQRAGPEQSVEGTDAITAIQKIVWKDLADDPKYTRNFFHKADHIVLLLRVKATNEVVGYQLVYPQKYYPHPENPADGDVPFIYDTTILPAHQGKRLPVLFMRELRKILRSLEPPARYFIRQADIENKWADKILKNEKHNVVGTPYEVQTKWGRKLHMKLKV